MQNKKVIKITAWVVLIATLLVVFLSCLFIVEHASHDCVGADCPICMAVERCSETIRAIGSSVALFAVLSMLTVIGCIMPADGECSYFSFSLISQKIRMNC